MECLLSGGCLLSHVRIVENILENRFVLRKYNDYQNFADMLYSFVELKKKFLPHH